MNYQKEFNKKENELWDLKEKFQTILAQTADLQKICQDKDFAIHNDYVFQLIIDYRRIFFIDLYEWIKSLYSSKSILNKMKANLHHFKVNINNYLILKNNTYNDKEHKNHKKRLCVCDIDFIRKKFDEINKQIKPLRNKNAHFYEIDSNKIINFKIIDLIPVFERIDELMFLISDIIGYQFISKIPIKQSQKQSKDLVKDINDIILCGSIGQIPYVKGRDEDMYKYTGSICNNMKSRDIFYNKLHKKHLNTSEKHLNTSEKYFNSREKYYWRYWEIE